MSKSLSFETAIPFPTIGIHGTAGGHMIVDQTLQRFALNIGHGNGSHTSIALQKTNNRRFTSCPASPFAFFLAPIIGLINVLYSGLEVMNYETPWQPRGIATTS